ncbi:MAG: hypothetical protein M3Q91_08390 [Acidobacteriota bacterium]|nr:hypothetical protein [Acidobacteriota bacterium]
MGREQMRNLETFKIGGSQVNEFEYQKHQGEMTEQLEHHPDAVPRSKQPTQAERVKQIMEAARQKVEKKRKKEAAKAGHSEQKSKAKPAAKVAGKATKKK